MNYRFAFVLVLAGFLLSGCQSRPQTAATGSKHTPGNQTDSAAVAGTETAVPTIQVDWPDITEEARDTQSALSLRLVLHGAGAGNSDVVIDGDRSTDRLAHTQSYHGGQTATVGPCGLEATYYSAAGLSGSIVASASADVAIASDGTITDPDGSPLSPFSFQYPQGANVPTSQTSAPAVRSERPTEHWAPVETRTTEPQSESPKPPRRPGPQAPPAVAYAPKAGTEVSVGPDSTSTTQPTPAFATNDFVNPGFEDPQIPNGTHTRGGPTVFWWGGDNSNGAWGVASGEGSWGRGAHSGSQYAFLQRGSKISQTLSGLVKGGRYQVVFWMMRRNGQVGGNNPTPLTLTVNSVNIYYVTPPSNGTTWVEYSSYDFVSDGTPATFEFSTRAGGPDSADLLDDIHLVRRPN